MVIMIDEADMNDVPISEAEVKNLRFLRMLVTALTVTMILGLLSIVALLVIRFTTENPVLVMPGNIELPDGAQATAFTQSVKWYAVVTTDNQILIYDRKSGELLQTVSVATK